MATSEDRCSVWVAVVRYIPWPVFALIALGMLYIPLWNALNAIPELMRGAERIDLGAFHVELKDLPDRQARELLLRTPRLARSGVLNIGDDGVRVWNRDVPGRADLMAVKELGLVDISETENPEKPFWQLNEEGKRIFEALDRFVRFMPSAENAPPP